jgi:hypothetical protein
MNAESKSIEVPQLLSNDKIDAVVDKVFNRVNECHFAKSNDEEGQVCAPNEMLEKMKAFAKAKGKNVPNNPKAVVQHMKDLLNCNSESCIFKRKDFVEFAKVANLEDIINTFYKPSGPATNFGLLSNFNIDDVLDQFEKRFAHRKFLHIPFQMRDFEKVGTELATIDLAEKLKSKYKTFGVVLNTDWSKNQGIHWYCIFGENYGDKIIIEYFNSSGKPPLPETEAWLQKTKHHLQKQLKIPVKIVYSTGIEFQFDNHSCGVYSLAYIWLRLEQVPPTWFRSDNFGDARMHSLRRNLFHSGE